MNTNKSFKFRRKLLISLSSMVLLMLTACCMLYAMTRTQCAIVRPIVGHIPPPSMPDTRGAILRKLTAETVLEPDQNVEYTDSADDYQVQDSTGQIGATPGDVHVPTNSMLRTNKSATKRLPDAIIVGVKKGGTRALLEFVRIHPDVRASGPETHYFDRHYHLGSEWYRNQMPATLEGQLTLEKTPSYFVTKEAPQRIAHMNKKTKIIIVVRDPVTRAISDYTQTSSKRPGMKQFEQMAILDNTTGIVDTSWGAIRIGVYAKHIERWLKYFPLSQICFINGEKLISNPAGELEKLQDFLGLKSVITDKHFFFNETKGFPCIKKPEGSANPKCLGKTKGRRHPHVEPRVLNRLQEFYRPFNAKFYQITNQNFGWP